MPQITRPHCNKSEKSGAVLFTNNNIHGHTRNTYGLAAAGFATDATAFRPLSNISRAARTEYICSDSSVGVSSIECGLAAGIATDMAASATVVVTGGVPAGVTSAGTRAFGTARATFAACAHV